MKYENEISRVIESSASLAVVLRLERPEVTDFKTLGLVTVGLSSEEIEDEIENIYEASNQLFDSLKEDFKRCVQVAARTLGEPVICVEGYSSENSHVPPWAVSFYAEWALDENQFFCLLHAGDGNPEEDLILLAGKADLTTKSSPMDPWSWQWEGLSEFYKEN